MKTENACKAKFQSSDSDAKFVTKLSFTYSDLDSGFSGCNAV